MENVFQIYIFTPTVFWIGLYFPIGVLANGFYFWELLKIGLMGSIMNVLYNKPALLKVEKIE